MIVHDYLQSDLHAFFLLFFLHVCHQNVNYGIALIQDKYCCVLLYIATKGDGAYEVGYVMSCAREWLGGHLGGAGYLGRYLAGARYLGGHLVGHLATD